MQLIYADTSIWNELCSQAVAPGKLASRLAARGERLALGLNVLFELVKTFAMDAEYATRRATQLFSYLSAWMDDDFPLLRQTPEILAEEVMHTLNPSKPRRIFVEGVEHQFYRDEIARLAKGELPSSRWEFITVRKSSLKQFRNDMRNEFRALPEAESRLAKVHIQELKDWLTSELRSERGVNDLALQLAPFLPGETFPRLRQTAETLLSSDDYKISHALVRNGIYLNWRFAHRGSVETSAFDDAYHVVNASYCRKFFTTDKEQVEQVSYSLPGVRVGYCEPGKLFDEWLSDNGY